MPGKKTSSAEYNLYPSYKLPSSNATSLEYNLYPSYSWSSRPSNSNSSYAKKK